MAAASSKTARFRSATDFPLKIESLDKEQTALLYAEMRECLIFTNKSRGQLIRRNTEHKDKVVNLRANIIHLQGLINQLQTQKQSQLKDREALIAQLSSEVTDMNTQLNTLSEAFESVGDLEADAETHWGRLMFPQRILKLLQAVRSLMQWWHRQDDSRPLTDNQTTPSLEGAEVNLIDEQHRRDYPHLYTDQASVNRDLLDR